MTMNFIPSNQRNPNPFANTTQSSEASVAVASTQEESAEFAAGFARVESEIAAVAEDDIVPVNIDVPSAVATVLGALPEVRALRAELAVLPGFDVAQLDKLRDYALALGHAHAMFRGAAGPVDRLAELGKAAAEVRDILQSDAMALANRGILDVAQVNKLRGGSGYKNIAFEVVGLVGLFRSRWSDVQGRTALQPEELEHAGKKAQELVVAVGLKEQQPAAINAAMLQRQRAFTLLANAYDHVRRGISYLRWDKNDADSIAPSLYGGRTRAPQEEVPPASNADVAPAVPAAAPITPPASPASNTVPVATGLPNSSPFQR